MSLIGTNIRKRNLNLIAVLLILAIDLTGCSSTNPADENSKIISKESQSGGANKWKCTSNSDALGSKSMFCSTAVDDTDNGIYWTLGFLCGTDGNLKHSVSGLFDSNMASVYWPTGNLQTSDVRIDNNDIEKWNFNAVASGQGIKFSLGQVDENSATWKFLFKIANASSFAFRAKDSSDIVRSAKFEVEHSAAIVAKFNVIGCKSP